MSSFWNEENLALLFNQTILGAILIPGVVGNLFALVTILSSDILRERVVSSILLVLYLVDTIDLILACGCHWVISIARIDVSMNEDFAADVGGSSLQVPRFSWLTLIFVIHYIVYTLSGFLVTLLTLERFLAITKPMKHFQQRLPRPKTKHMVIALSVLAFLIYLPCFRHENVVFYWNSRSSNLDLVDSYLRWTTTITLFVCACLTIPANIIIILYYKKSVKKREKLQESLTEDDSRRGELKVTFVLVSVSCIFFFFTIPNRILVMLMVAAKISFPELFISLSWTSCHVKVALNSFFFFFVSAECRAEAKKALCKCKKSRSKELESDEEIEVETL